MHLNPLLDRDAPCPELAHCPAVSCENQCSKTESCSVVAQSCPSTCAKTRCDPIPGQHSGSSGASPGALAGAVIGALLFLAFVVLGYFYYRRREAAKEAAAREQATVDVKPDIPARADAVLSRPDPHIGHRASSIPSSEKPPAMNRAGSGDATELGTVRVYNSQSDTTINLDPSHRQGGTPSVRSNPFADGASIQTASDRSQSTNVIPIALVPPGGHSPDSLSQARAGPPSHPERSQDPSLRDNPLDLEHVAVSDSELDDPRRPYAASARSGISGKSFMTTSSIATDLDEPPMIMSPREGVVRQVFGVSQAQVVQAPSSAGASGVSSMPTSPNPPNSAMRTGRSTLSPKAAARASRGTIGRSPLAQQSFTPRDIPLAKREPTSPMSTTTVRSDPFSDAASPNNRNSFADSSRSTDTFGSPNEYHSEGPFTPRPGATFADAASRPVSVASTADGVSIRADIGTASRVILGMQSPTYGPVLSPGGGSQSRATSMQTNSGRTVMSVDRDDDDDSVRRHSLISAKTTSSRADSVLAGYPFVPPSPISALPPRSPRSPNTASPGNSPASTGSMFARQQQVNSPSIAAHSPPASPGSPASSTGTRSTVTQRPSPRQLAPPPVPKIPREHAERGESTLSTSTASGLETYPFQFGSPSTTTGEGEDRSGSRASLDTLALSRDLAAFPLEYERSSMANSQKSTK